MKVRTWMIAVALVTACAACGDDPEVQSNNANNTSNNANNTSNNGTSNTPNNGTSNTPNNGTSNTPNNSTNSTNSMTNNNTNSMTNSNPNNGNPLTCNGDFGAADACGGDPAGTWDVSEACTNYDYEAALQGACSDAVVSDAVVNVTGTLTVDATNWTREVMGDISLNLSTATGCGAGNCGLVEAGLGVVADATCTDNGAGGCDCTATVDLSSSTSGTYTAENGVVTIGSGETFYYCSSGGTMLIREFGTMADDNQPTVLYEK